MSLKLESPGLLTTIQDLGRFGYQRDGVVVSGAMDALALRIGNLLVGNDEGVAAIELTHPGPEIRFEKDLLIALTGADLSPTLNGEKIKMWRPLLVEQGSLLQFGRPQIGRFAYVTVSGGMKIPELMGSCSTCLSAGFGGWKGRALEHEDYIPCRGVVEKALRLLRNAKIPGSRQKVANWMPAPRFLPRYEEDPVIRAIKGPEYEWFTEESKRAFWENSFVVKQQSNRMAYQLEGPGLSLQKVAELISTAVSFGTIQVPPAGKPIALMADHQTTGGYPRIAQVISADLSRMVQLQPGKSIRFEEVSLEEAQQLFCRQEVRLEYLKRAIFVKMS